MTEVLRSNALLSLRLGTRLSPRLWPRLGPRLAGLLLATLFILLTAVTRAQEAGRVFVVSAPSAVLYTAPDETKKSTTSVQRGRRVELAGAEQNGYYPISTRSGAKVWIKKADVTPEISNEDVVEPRTSEEPATPRKSNSRPRRPVARADERSSSILGLERLTFDLGASMGSVNNVTYTEFDLGLNAYFKEWLAWRNAVFARLMSGADTIYGLDSSVRGILNVSGAVAGFTAFAGPGYRFVNQGRNVPFVEGGVILKLIGLSIGGGVKTLLNSWIISGAPNDTQYFLILAGGGSL